MHVELFASVGMPGTYFPVSPAACREFYFRPFFPPTSGDSVTGSTPYREILPGIFQKKQLSFSKLLRQNTNFNKQIFRRGGIELCFIFIK
jgi:hypothetical protein